MHVLRAPLDVPDQLHQNQLIHIKKHRFAPPSLAHALPLRAQFCMSKSLLTGSQKSELSSSFLKLKFRPNFRPKVEAESNLQDPPIMTWLYFVHNGIYRVILRTAWYILRYTMYSPWDFPGDLSARGLKRPGTSRGLLLRYGCLVC